MTFLRIVIPLHLFVSLKRGSKARACDDAWGRDLRRHRSGQREQSGVLTLGRPSDICIATFDRLAAAWRTLLMRQTKRKPEDSFYIEPRNGKRYPLDKPRWCADGLKPLLISPQRGIARDEIDRGTRSLWRYQASLPVEISKPISLGVWRGRWHAREDTGSCLYVACEGRPGSRLRCRSAARRGAARRIPERGDTPVRTDLLLQP